MILLSNTDKHLMPAQNQVPLTHKLGLFVFFVIGFLVCYVYPNFYPRYTPSLLPLTFVDRHTALMPWTFLIYLSDYLFVALPVFFVTDRKGFYGYGRRMYACLYVSGLVFLLYPTRYLRPEYPVSNAFLEAAMRLISTADMPNNCFPSMHVALTIIAAMSMRGISKRWTAVCTVWTVAICLSTLTTKQHYLVDVVGGCVVAFAVIQLDRLWVVSGRLAFMRRMVPGAKTLPAQSPSEESQSDQRKAS